MNHSIIYYKYSVSKKIKVPKLQQIRIPKFQSFKMSKFQPFKLFNVSQLQRFKFQKNDFRNFRNIGTHNSTKNNALGAHMFNNNLFLNDVRYFLHSLKCFCNK